MHKLIEASVIAAIGVLVFASLLIPVVDQATATTDTFNNDGYFHLNKIESSDTETYTISWDSTNAGVLVINGVNVPVVDTNAGTFLQYSIFASETDMIRIGTSDATGTSLAWVQIRGGQIAYATTSTEFNATISEGTLTATFGENDTRTATYTTAYIIDEMGKGAYVMKKSNELAYMLADSTIYGVGFTSPAIYRVSGNILDVDVTVLQSGSEVVTVSNETVTYSPVAGYNGLYKFDKVTFDADVNGTVSTATYSYVIVPASVTAEKAIHADEPTRDILAVLPLILICALIMGVLGYAVYTRIE